MTPVEIHTQDGLVQLEHLTVAAMSAASLGGTLSKINRYAGRTVEPWSVAAHSVLVSRLCHHQEEQAWGLLHDAHEAFIGDIVTPAVTFIANQSRPVAGTIVENCVREAKSKLDLQIRAAWDIDPSVVDLEEVAHYDRIALEAEMLFFFGATPSADPNGDIDRAIELLRGLPNSGNWQASYSLWVSEAERLAHLGACRLPSTTTEQAA